MKRLVPLILLAILTSGCHKKHGVGVSIPGLTTDTPAPSASPKTVLVWGQSNAAYMDPAGHRGWNETRGAADIIINCAVPGARLDQFNEAGPFFQACVQKVAGRHVDVILGYQGESDANPGIGGSAFDYAQRFTAFLGILRKNFGDCPIIFAQIGVIGPSLVAGFPNWQEIKDQQERVCYPNTTMIHTDDITAGSPLHNDDIHWSDPGYYEIGSRFARAYMNLHLE